MPLGKYCVKASFNVLPSSESVQSALSSVRPFILRMISQMLGPFTVMDRVVPLRAGWSVASATIVSTASGLKVMVYLFSPTASTFISSVSLLLEGFTFHLPTKGSLAAHNVPIARQQLAATEDYAVAFAFLNPILGRSPCRGECREQL